MQVELEMRAAGASWRWTPAVRAVLNGGWTGRDMAAVRAHVEEMRALGVPAPTEVPIVFPVARDADAGGSGGDLLAAELRGSRVRARGDPGARRRDRRERSYRPSGRGHF